MAAQGRHANPNHRPSQALADLYELMNDKTIKTRVRLNAAISASRVEPLGLLAGERSPPAITFLRNIMEYQRDGRKLAAEWRREAGAALAYWERRAKSAQLKYVVADTSEQRESWRMIINAALRAHLWKHGRWPTCKNLLLSPTDDFDCPEYDPQLAIAAIILPPSQQRRRRVRSVDEPELPFVASEFQRREILRAVAQAMHARLQSTAAAA